MSKDGLLRDIGAALTAVALVASVACGAPPQKSIEGFEVVSLKVVPSEVSIGQEAKVTAKIVNVGEAQDTYTAVLMTNDVESQKKDLVIPAEDIGIVTFSIVKHEAGTYLLAIDQLNASLSVSDPMQTIRSAWETFEPLADGALMLWRLIMNRNLYDTEQITFAKYQEQKDAGLAKMGEYLEKVGNQELRELGIAVTQSPAPPNVAKLTAEFYGLYYDSLEAAMNDLRSSLGTEQKSVAQQELQAAWDSMKPLAQLALLVLENLRDWALLQAGEITESDYSTRSNTQTEEIDASLDELGNKDFTKKFTTAWFKPFGAEKVKLWAEFIELYQSMLSAAMEDFSQELGQQ